MDWKAIAKIVGGIVAGLVLLLAAAIIMGGGVKEEIPADTSPARTIITLTDAGILDSGGDAFTAYASLNHTSSKIISLEVEYLVFEKPPLRQVYLLDYPHREADNYSAFANSLSTELALYNITLMNVSAEEAGRVRDAILVVPSGGLPTPLLGENGPLAFLLQSGSAVVVLSSDLTIGIRPDGAITPLEQAEIERFTRHPYFVSKPALNDWQNASGAGVEVARMALYNSWQAPKGQRTMRFGINNATDGKLMAFSTPSGSPIGVSQASSYWTTLARLANLSNAIAIAEKYRTSFSPELKC